MANEKPLPFIFTDSLGFCSLALSARQSWQRTQTGGKAGAHRGRTSSPCHCKPHSRLMKIVLAKDAKAGATRAEMP